MAVILILRALGIGDLLTAVPALRALRRHRPSDRIVLAAPPALAPLARLTGAVDAVHPTAGLGRTRLPPGPSLAVNLHGRGPQSIAELLRTRPRSLLTHRHEEYPGISGPEWVEDMHEVHRWCRLLRFAGITGDPGDLYLHPGPSRRRRGTVVVHPGAGAPARQWPPQRFAAVAAHLHRAGVPLVLTVSAAERDLALSVAATAGIPADRVLAGQLDLADTAALVGGAALVVCGDTGMGHLATAVRTPSVLLFGPSAPDRWGPPAGSADLHRVLWSGTTGDPLGDTTDPGLASITVSQVLAAVDDRIAATPMEFGHVG